MLSYSNTMNKQTVATSSQITQQYDISTWIFNTKIQCNITVRIVAHNAKCVAIKICIHIIRSSLHFALLYVVQLMYMQSQYWLILICY